MTDEERIAALESRVAGQEKNLQRLITEVERLVDELARRPGSLTLEANGPEAALDNSPETPFRWKAPLAVAIVLGVCFIAAFFAASRWNAGPSSASAHSGVSSASNPLERARQFENAKDYPRAEAAYRLALASDPDNADAIRHLASVLFRQDKLEESAAVLNGMKSRK